MLFFIYFLLGIYLIFYLKNYITIIDNCFILFFKKIFHYLEYDIEKIENFPSKIIFISTHTSIYDFIFGFIFYYGYLYKDYKTFVLMKESFEKICNPFLTFFNINKFKLISIKNNVKKTGLTEKICNTLKNDNNYIIYLAPEGTRKCTDKLRKGYWYIAKNLDIHIIFIGFDYKNKTIMFEKPRKVFETWEEEEEEFKKCCRKYVPLYPDRCFWTKDFYD